MNSQDIPRKLTTILAADVVAYSRLMAADEEATLRTLKTYRGVIDGLIDRHHGRLVGTAGDAVLVEFGSAVEAVRCAISIQEDLRVRNAELPEDRQMLFRVGINVGDVMIEGDDLFGDGVNVAARLEGLADPGGICISGSTFDQVKNKLSTGFEDMGPQQVKNIPQPVPTFRIVSGPVSVLADQGADAATANRARWRMPAIALVLVAVIAGGGAAVWNFYLRGPAPIASFPENISTDNMRSKDIEAFMAGMNIQGISRRNGRPFTITVKQDNTVDVAMGRSGALEGTTFRETGKWWAENYRFCMQFSRFAQGRQLCPRIVKTGEKITATRRDGSSIPWTINK